MGLKRRRFRLSDNVHIGESNNEWIGATIEREITDGSAGKPLYSNLHGSKRAKETKSAQQEIDICHPRH